jgi:hypothetical protein
VRWRHEAGLLVLKVTDDRTVSLSLDLTLTALGAHRHFSLPFPLSQCLKFKTRSAVFLNRFELLNRSLLAQFQHRKPSAPPPSFPAPSAPSGADKTQPDPAAAPLPPTTVPSADEQPKPKKKKSKKKK